MYMVIIRFSLILFSLSLLGGCYASGTLGVIQQVTNGVSILEVGKNVIESSTKENKKDN
jgi:hypothetical protein